MLAKALYDNDAESEGEISFQRGDVVTVLQLDPNGLEGWWLCSFKGRIGIAPGNRLKGLADEEPETEGEVTMREKSDASVPRQRSSYVYDPNKVITPSNIGGVFVYSSPEQPTPQDYDIPRSRTEGVSQPPVSMDNYDTPKSKMDLYDSPKSTAAHVKTIEDMYDKPKSRRLLTGHLGQHLETQSNRSSGISMLSSVSGTSVSNQSLHSADSAPSSVRSSADATHDPYDIPQRAKAVNKSNLRKAKSSDNILDDMYDSPRRGVRWAKSGTQADYQLADRPGGDYCEIQEGKTNYGPNKPSTGFRPRLPQRSKSREHALDDVEAYDTPKKSSHREELQPAGRVQGYQMRGHVDKSGIYDVPPQVTRDSPIQDSGMGSSMAGSDSKSLDLSRVTYSELVLERDAAVELLVKLQEDLQKATSKLLYFVNRTWRRREHLQPKMFDVKISCLAVRTALEEFVEFGQGALANGLKREDKSLARKLGIYLGPVQRSFAKISQCMTNLDAIKWDVNKLSTEVVDSTIIDDDLNQIVRETNGITINFIQLGSYIKGNAALLFKTNKGVEEPIHDIVPKSTPKPPPIKPKPSLGSAETKSSPDGSGIKAKTIQTRPLPNPPPSQKPLPPLPSTAHSTTTTIQASPASKSSLPAAFASGYQRSPQQPASAPLVPTASDDYDIPKTQQEKIELKELQQRQQARMMQMAKERAAAQESKEYDNAKPMRLPSEDYDQVGELEYDYVALTPDQMKNSLAFKYSQMPGSDYDSPKGNAVGCYDTPNSLATAAYDSSGHEQMPGGVYDSPNTSFSLKMYDSPQNNSRVLPGQKKKFNESFDLDMTGQLEGMEVPSVHTSGLSSRFEEKLVRLQKEAESNVVVQGNRVDVEPVSPYKKSSEVSETDRQVLLFYANQVESHFSVLVNAMETLFQAMDYNQPPKVFITNSKFVILAAHKLVYMADTINRNISNRDIGQGIMLGANLLCDALKQTVNATKKAALHFPSVEASQEMVDRVVDVSHAAGALKAAIIQPVSS